jgi:hypothetical protein
VIEPCEEGKGQPHRCKRDDARQERAVQAGEKFLLTFVSDATWHFVAHPLRLGSAAISGENMKRQCHFYNTKVHFYIICAGLSGLTFLAYSKTAILRTDIGLFHAHL